MVVTVRRRPFSVSRVVHAIRRRIINRGFRVNQLRGAFQSFDEASASAPPIKPIGYDNADSGAWYEEKFKEVWLEDYPVLFWLKDGFEEGQSVFEIGGHVGEAFYAFEGLLTYPDKLRWIILDVPSIVSEGRKIASQRGENRLSFVDTHEDLPKCDIVLSAGALQYFDKPVLVETIQTLPEKPRHIVINNTPMYEGEAYVTLQNTGSVYCPYRIFNRSQFVASIENEGYKLTDSWHKDRRVDIPKHPELSFDRYSGLYFRRTE